MKGGITSGVIYPPLVARLAARFRLCNLGGTSAGAIAAAAAAAAEHGRRRGSPDAFAALAALPAQLASPGRRRGATVLRELFQPTAGTARLFGVVAALGSRGSRTRRCGRAAAALARAFPLTTLAAAVPAAVALAAAWRTGGALGLAAAAAAALLGATFLAAALLARLCRALLRVVPAHAFGLCSGMPARPGGPPALTPWLADLLDRLAGRDPAGPPLTFGDLWGCRPEPGATEPFPPEGTRQVHLQMTTTCLTLGRPFTLPLSDRRFFFDPAELRAFFPERVVRWMEEHPRRPPRAGDPVAPGRRLVPLPAPADLPVVVAARMSSSFPLLLAAIPLWAVDYSRPANRRGGPGEEAGGADDGGEAGGDAGEVAPTSAGGEAAGASIPERAPAGAGGPAAAAPPPPEAERCWFSDGGICSNFPVHFFDAPLPGRPTFGVNLRPFHPDFPGSEVFLAAERGGHLEWWSRLRPGRGALPSFLGAIAGTMQSWRDNVQLAVPGYRERVAHVAHRADEGGLNLDMPAAVVERLGARGEAAAGRLAEAFAAGEPDDAWARHRWTRFRSTMALLQEALFGLRDAYHGHGYAALLARRPGEPPRNYPLSGDRRADAEDLVARLLALVEDWEQHDEEVFGEGAPRPRPELRIAPRL